MQTKLTQKHANLILLCSLVLLSTLTILNSPNQIIENNNNNYFQNSPESAVIVSPAVFNPYNMKIDFIYQQEIPYVQTYFQIRNEYDAGDAIGTYSSRLDYDGFAGSSSLYHFTTGLGTGLEIYDTPATEYSMRTDYVNSRIKIYSNYLLKNNSVGNVYNCALDDFYLNIVTSNYNDATISSQTFNLGTLSLTYHLELPIFLNSTYYNRDNTQIYVKTTISAWKQTNYESLFVDHCYYQLKIIDKETNNVIFEDLTQQLWIKSRTITIESLKVQNNAAEPIQTEMLKNGHYQGAISFDQDLVNTIPAGWSKSSTISSIVNNEQNSHQKVLKIGNSVADSEYTYKLIDLNVGTFEFYVLYAQDNRDFLIGLLASSTFAITIRTSSSQTISIVNSSTLTACASYAANQWYHFRIELRTNTFDVYMNNTLIANNFTRQTTNGVNNFQIMQRYAGSHIIYIDAIDLSDSSDYYINRNQALNQSSELYSWNAFPQWDSGYYQNANFFSSSMNAQSGHGKIEYFSALENHSNVLKIIDNSTTSTLNLDYKTFTSSAIVEFWIKKNSTVNMGPLLLLLNAATRGIYLGVTDKLVFYNVSNGALLLNYAIDTSIWNHISLVFANNNISVYVNSILILNAYVAANNTYKFGTVGNYFHHNQYYEFLIADFDYSAATNYFVNRNMLENTTTSPLPIATNLTLQTNPYAATLSNFTAGNYLYRSSDLYNNTLKWDSITNVENQIIYTPPNVREHFLTFANQRNDYLAWENYRIYLNASQIYSNRFYREINSITNISIYTRDNRYLTSYIHNTTRDDNYIPITLTQFSLKIYNQQERFLFVNITYDSNYYISNQYWSQWVAPSEQVSYFLSPAYYKVNITEYETFQVASSTTYSYNLNGDDILLISSLNTIANAIFNIQNVNSTIGNQVSNVVIDLTNQNSNISNQIVNIEINLNNTNSNLSTILINQQNSINSLGQNLTTFMLNQENSFNLTGAQITNLYDLTYNTNTYTNSSIGQILAITENTNEYLNSTLGSVYSISSASFAYLNSSINNSITYMSQNFTALNSSINNNQFAILTQFEIVSSNITNNSIAIQNAINSVNSTIQNMTTELSQYILLVNNSIYTAMFNSTYGLYLQGNNILGNLSIGFELNPELTSILTNTRFSEFMTWKQDPEFMRAQTELYAISNNYNQSVLMSLKYKDELQESIQNLTIEADGVISDSMINDNVSYRVTTMDGTVLEEWKDLSNTTVELGFYEAELPNVLLNETPLWFKVAFFTILCFGSVLVSILLYYRARAKSTRSDSINDLYETQIYRNAYRR